MEQTAVDDAETISSETVLAILVLSVEFDSDTKSKGMALVAVVDGVSLTCVSISER
jgi:hypothetical protein